MWQIFQQWYQRRFAEPELAVLWLFLILIAGMLYLWTNVLAPVLVAVTLAYLLEKPVQRLIKIGISRWLAVSCLLSALLLIILYATLAMLPVIWQQSQNFMTQVPQMISNGRHYLQALPDALPGLLSDQQMHQFINKIDNNVLEFIDDLVVTSWSGVTGVIRIAVFLILVPMMVFFLLKDKTKLLAQLTPLLPTRSGLIRQVWRELDGQIMGYIQGKLVELLLVAAVTYVVFAWFELQFALMLAVLVGCSVLVPYIGIAVVTVPVVLVALSQWGLTSITGSLLAAYLLVQMLDAYLLVPLLFSQVVDINPLYIIIAVLFFGGLFGFWGVFFAIPLASLVKATYHATQSAQAPSRKT